MGSKPIRLSACIRTIIITTVIQYLQFKRFIENWIQSFPNCLCLLLAGLFWVRNELDLDVRIRIAIGVHGNEILWFTNCKGIRTTIQKLTIQPLWPSVCTVITNGWQPIMVRTKKYTSSPRQVAWTIFLQHFDIFHALARYTYTPPNGMRLLFCFIHFLFNFGWFMTSVRCVLPLIKTVLQ